MRETRQETNIVKPTRVPKGRNVLKDDDKRVSGYCPWGHPQAVRMAGRQDEKGPWRSGVCGISRRKPRREHWVISSRTSGFVRRLAGRGRFWGSGREREVLGDGVIP